MVGSSPGQDHALHPDLGLLLGEVVLELLMTLLGTARRAMRANVSVASP
jgi:hypothetical protein